jgi:WD40 repeat protein
MHARIPLVSILGLILAGVLAGCGFLAAKPPPGLVRTLSGHGYWVNSVAWSPDGQYLASGSSDRTVRVWDVASGWTLATLTRFQGGVNVLAWSPNGKYLATGSAEPNDTFRVWDSITWRPVFGVDPALHGRNDAVVNSIAWAPDGQRVAVGLQGRTTKGVPVDSWVKLYDADSWQNSSTFLDPHGVGSVAWAPDGRRLGYVSASARGGLVSRVVTWSPIQGENPARRTATLIEHNDLLTTMAWSPNGKYIATDGSLSDEVIIWEVASGQRVSRFSGHSATVQSVAWSPNGKWVASGGLDNLIQVWDAASGQNTYTFRHGDFVQSVVWSPDSKYLGVGCVNRRVYIWEVK